MCGRQAASPNRSLVLNSTSTSNGAHPDPNQPHSYPTYYFTVAIPLTHPPARPFAPPSLPPKFGCFMGNYLRASCPASQSSSWIKNCRFDAQSQMKHEDCRCPGSPVVPRERRRPKQTDFEISNGSNQELTFVLKQSKVDKNTNSPIHRFDLCPPPVSRYLPGRRPDPCRRIDSTQARSRETFPGRSHISVHGPAREPGSSKHERSGGKTLLPNSEDPSTDPAMSTQCVFSRAWVKRSARIDGMHAVTADADPDVRTG